MPGQNRGIFHCFNRKARPALAATLGDEKSEAPYPKPARYRQGYSNALSFGALNKAFISSEIGILRFSPLGGMGFMNHLL